MISCACGCRSIGKHPGEQVAVVVQRPAICGVSEDVAQVSSTSGSAAKPPGWSRWSGVVPGRHVDRGIHRQAASAGSDRLR